MKTRRKIEIFASPEKLAQKSAEMISEKLSGILRDKNRASLVLSGGSTPKLLYELLASEGYRNSVQWDKVLIFFGDERCVPPDDPQSNYKMAYEVLLSKVPIRAENVFRMKGELAPAEAAKEYEENIKNSLGDGTHFDIVLLGIGADGHTASLFPESTALSETKKLVSANYVEKLNAYRLTLTLPAINASQNILFLVSGKDKAETVKAVFDGTSDPPLPSQLVYADNAEVTWLLDSPAAAFLSNKKTT